MHFTDQEVQSVLRDKLQERGPAKSLCPSEIARELAPDDWRPLLPQVRRIAFQMANAGELEVLQRGESVAPAPVRGPIRLRILPGS